MHTGNIHKCDNELHVSTVCSRDEIEGIRSVWEKLQNDEPYPKINADIDRYLSYIMASERKIKPYIMVLHRNGCPVAIAIGRIEKQTINCRIGYKTFLKFPMQCLSIVYGGIIGEKTGEICTRIIQELTNALKEKKTNVVFLSHIKVNSILHKYARKIPGVLNHSYFSKIEHHWNILLPDSFDKFLKSCSKNRRKHFRRYVKKLEEKFPGQVRAVAYSTEEQLDEVIKIISQISLDTYQYGLGAGFVNNTKTRVMLTNAARKGWLRIHVLFIKEEPCAFRIAIKYRNTYFGEQAGYSPKWAGYNVGTVLFLRVMEIICENPTLEILDFGYGGGEHKRWADNVPWEEISMHIFAPRFYPIFVNMINSLLSGMSAGFRCILFRSGFINYIKRYWRSLLVGKRDNK